MPMIVPEKGSARTTFLDRDCFRHTTRRLRSSIVDRLIDSLDISSRETPNQARPFIRWSTIGMWGVSQWSRSGTSMSRPSRRDRARTIRRRGMALRRIAVFPTLAAIIYFFQILPEGQMRPMIANFEDQSYLHDNANARSTCVSSHCYT